MKNNKKILKQGLLISCAVLFSVQNVVATCTNTTTDDARTAGNALAREAEAAATQAENLRDEICPPCYDTWVSAAITKKDIATTKAAAAKTALKTIKDNANISCDDAKKAADSTPTKDK